MPQETLSAVTCNLSPITCKFASAVTCGLLPACPGAPWTAYNLVTYVGYGRDSRQARSQVRVVLVDAFAGNRRLHVRQHEVDGRDFARNSSWSWRRVFRARSVCKLAQICAVSVCPSCAASTLVADEFRSLPGRSCALVQMDGHDRGPERSGRTEPGIARPSH